MRVKLLRTLILIFLLLLIFLMVFVNLDKPRILILHSYALNYTWVTDINIGIRRVLKGKPYTIRWHYMDTKRHTSNDFMEKAGKTAIQMIEDWKPNVIIAVDDNAQRIVFKQKKNKPIIPPLDVTKRFLNDRHINIVFTGVNATAESYGYDKGNNVTGVLERIPFNEFKEVFLQVLPQNKRRIVHISDSSSTSEGIFKELETVDWHPLKLVYSLRVDTFDEWKAAVKKSAELGDILLVTHYHTIKEFKNSKESMEPRKVIEWTKANSTLPQIGCWGFFVEDGGMMAVAVSPFEQGEEAAKMAVEIIENGKNPRNIPVKTSKLYVMYVSEPLVKKHKLVLPKIIEAFARATNNYFD